MGDEFSLMCASNIRKLPGNYGFTPLHEAVHKGHLTLARLLVESGADPAARSTDGETVLDAAVIGGNPELVLWLTQLLADH